MSEKKRFRMTRQRKIILEELRNLHTHPTADEVYERVRKRLPRISLGTVYRNLEVLSESGLIKKLNGTPMRFDGKLDAHHHARCLRCSKVEDVQLKRKIGLKDLDGGLEGWNLVERRVELWGLCPDCNKMAN